MLRVMVVNPLAVGVDGGRDGAAGALADELLVEGGVEQAAKTPRATIAGATTLARRTRGDMERPTF
jgi:hypothetical protein